MVKEINRKAVMNELKKHVNLIEDSNIKNKLKQQVEEEQKARIKKMESKRSKLKMLIEDADMDNEDQEDQMEIEN